MSEKHTVEMTKGADTIYVPAEQEAYFRELGYSATSTKTTYNKTKETAR